MGVKLFYTKVADRANRVKILRLRASFRAPKALPRWPRRCNTINEVDHRFSEAGVSRISRLDRSDVTPDIASLYDKIFSQRGNVPNMFRVMAHRPEIFSTMQAHFAAVLNTGTVPTRLKELIIVRTSQINETPYCLASHTILARNLGWTDDQLSHLADWPQRNDFTPPEKAALRLAETVTRDAHALSDEQFAELRGYYSEGEIVELLCAIGLFNYFNRFNNALRMEPTRPGEGGCASPSIAAAVVK
jgi:uncharacterized peroxidase-related enzyme